MYSSRDNLSQFSFFGGNIVDAHLADRPGTDTFREVFVAQGLGEVRVEKIGIVRDGTDGEMAVIRTEGNAQGALILQGVLPNTFLPPAPMSPQSIVFVQTQTESTF